MTEPVLVYGSDMKHRWFDDGHIGLDVIRLRCAGCSALVIKKVEDPHEPVTWASCEEYTEHRIACEAKLPPPDIDGDLATLGHAGLLAEVKKLRAGIRADRDVRGHNLCWYRPELWNLLPERVTPSPEPPPEDEFLAKCAEFRASLVRPVDS